MNNAWPGNWAVAGRPAPPAAGTLEYVPTDLADEAGYRELATRSPGSTPGRPEAARRLSSLR
jgi:hypothetical protein